MATAEERERATNMVLRSEVQDYLDAQGLDSSTHSIDLVIGRLLTEGQLDVTDVPQASTGPLARAADLARDLVSPFGLLAAPETQQRFREGYTPAHVAGEEEVSAAYGEGQGAVLRALARNPMQVVGGAAKSVFPMMAGGATGRGLVALAGGRIGPMAAGTIGEGLVAAGMSQPGLPESATATERALHAIGVGVGTATAGRAMGRLAERAGGVDPERILAGLGVAPGRLALPERLQWISRLTGIPLEGIEEWSQEAQQAVFDNLVAGRPWAEGVPEAGMHGAVIGSTVAAGMTPLTGRGRLEQLTTPPPAEEPEPEPEPEPEEEPEPAPKPKPERPPKADELAEPEPPAEPALDVSRSSAAETEVAPAPEEEPAPPADDERNVRLVEGVRERQENARAALAALEDTEENAAARADAEYRIARGDQMAEAAGKQSERLARALDRIRRQFGTREGRLKDEGRALARDVVADRVAARLELEGDKAGALALDNALDRDLARYWAAAETEYGGTGGDEAASLVRPDYQEEALYQRFRTGAEDAPAPAAAAEGEYDHSTDTGGGEGKIAEASALEPSAESAARFPGTGEEWQAHFAIVSADDVTPSHYQGARSPAAKYPAEMQGRDYATGTDEDREVQKQTGSARVNLLVEHPKSVQEGVPTLLPSGAALAGNQRAMIAKGQYALGGQAAEDYRDAVLDEAFEMGLSVPKGMERPMLVRVLEPDPRLGDVAELQRLNQESDAAPQKQKTEGTVAAGRQQRLNAFVDLVRENVKTAPEPDETMAAFLQRVGGGEIAAAIARDEVFSSQELLRYTRQETEDGRRVARLNFEGARQIEQLLRQRAIRSEGAGAEMPFWIDQKLDNAWHLVVAAEENTRLPIHRMLQDVVPYVRAAKAAKFSVADFWKQTRQGEGGELETWPKFLGQFAGWIQQNSAADVRKAFASLARVSTEASVFAPAPTPEELFTSAFPETKRKDAVVAEAVGSEGAKWEWGTAAEPQTPREPLTAARTETEPEAPDPERAGPGRYTVPNIEERGLKRYVVLRDGAEVGTLRAVTKNGKERWLVDVEGKGRLHYATRQKALAALESGTGRGQVAGADVRPVAARGELHRRVPKGRRTPAVTAERIREKETRQKSFERVFVDDRQIGEIETSMLSDGSYLGRRLHLTGKQPEQFLRMEALEDRIDRETGAAPAIPKDAPVEVRRVQGDYWLLERDGVPAGVVYDSGQRSAKGSRWTLFIEGEGIRGMFRTRDAAANWFARDLGVDRTEWKKTPRRTAAAEERTPPAAPAEERRQQATLFSRRRPGGLPSQREMKVDDEPDVPPQMQDTFDVRPDPPETVPPDPEALRGFDMRALHELTTSIGTAIRIAPRRIAKQMKERGAQGVAYEKGLRIFLEPDEFNYMSLDEKRALVAHELGHIAEMIGPDTDVPDTPVGRILRLLGVVSRHMNPSRMDWSGPAMQQMIDVQKAFSPYPEMDSPDADAEYIAYRSDPREVWANAFSAVLSSPSWVRENYPDFWAAFHDNMPERTRTPYKRLVEELRSEEGRLERDVEWQEGLHQRQLEEAAIRDAEALEEKRTRDRSVFKDVEVEFVARSAPLRRLAARAIREGELDPEANPAAMAAQSFDRETVLADRFWAVPKALNEAGVSQKEHDDFLRNRMIRTGDAVFDKQGYAEAMAEWKEEHKGTRYADRDVESIPKPYEFVTFVHRLNLAGFDPESSGRLLRDQENRLSAKQYTALWDASRPVWDAMTETVEELQRSGILPQTPDFDDPETAIRIAKHGLDDRTAAVLAMQQSEHYVPRAVLDFGGSPKVSGVPMERRGSVRDWDVMLDAAEQKVERALRAVHLNDTKRATLDFLRRLGGKFEPKQVQAEWRGESTEGGRTTPGAWVMTGKDAEIHRHKAVLSEWVDGKQTHYAVNPWVAAAFARTDGAPGLVWLRKANMFTRTMFLTINPAWHVANAIRDFQRAWRNNPRYSRVMPIGMAQLAADYVRYLPIAIEAGRTSGERRRRADRGSRTAQQFLAAERAGVLPSQYRADVIYGDMGERVFDRFKTSDYLDMPLDAKQREVGAAASAWAFMKNVGLLAPAAMYVAEATPRIAAYQRALEQGGGTDGRLSLEETRRIRERIGSPPFDAALRGRNPVFGAYLQFSVSTINGWITDYQALRDPGDPYGSLIKSSQTVGLVALTLAIRAGVFGGEEEDHPLHPVVMTLREGPSWELGGAIHVPIPWLFDHENNRSTMFQFPIDHFFLPITTAMARTWKEHEARKVAGEDANVITVMGDLAWNIVAESRRTFPGPSATIDWAYDLAQVASGRNPYDAFRERNWFSDREWERLTPAERMSKFLLNITPRQFAMPVTAEVLPKLARRPDFLPSGVGKQEIPFVDALVRRFLTTREHGLPETARMAGDRARIAERREEKPSQTGPWGADWARGNEDVADYATLKREARAFAREVEPEKRKRTSVMRAAAREAFFRMERNAKWRALKPITWPSVEGGETEIRAELLSIIRSGTRSRQEVGQVIRDLQRSGVIGPARVKLFRDVLRAAGGA